jgi:hypothetical protein
MKTGGHLSIVSMGDSVLGVRLEGNPKKPEPPYFRVTFPGGDVSVERCTNGDNWIHIRVNRKDDGDDPERQFARIVDARLDCHDGKAAHKRNLGDFKNESLYHVAVRVTLGDESSI